MPSTSPRILLRRSIAILPALAAAFALASSTPAHAGLLTNLSTGQGLSNLQVDPIWDVTSSYFSNAWKDTKVLDGPGFPFGPWIANTATSKWIAPNDPAFTQNNAPAASGPDLLFTYRTSFNISSSQLATARIAGLGSNGARWTSDNDGLQILLNGNVISNTNTGSGAYSSWHGIADVTTGFTAGLNTLEFIVKNRSQASGNPTGFRLEAGLYADASVVPEPTSIALGALGAGLFGVTAWRRRRTSAHA